VNDLPRDALRGRRLLIVEDEDSLRTILAKMLGVLGVEVEQASSGGEALGTLDVSRPFDLVLSDVRMAGGDGMELLRGMRARGGGPPLVFMSGYSDVAEGAALEAGASAVLLKPFGLADLIAVIGPLLGR
jgi:CheY-like chemotaxis protein